MPLDHWGTGPCKPPMSHLGIHQAMALAMVQVLAKAASASVGASMEARNRCTICPCKMRSSLRKPCSTL